MVFVGTCQYPTDVIRRNTFQYTVTHFHKGSCKGLSNTQRIFFSVPLQISLSLASRLISFAGVAHVVEPSCGIGACAKISWCCWLGIPSDEGTWKTLSPKHQDTHTYAPNYTSRKCDNVRLMVRIGALSSPLPNVFAAPMNDQRWVALKTCKLPRTLNDLAILGNAFMRQSWDTIDIYWHCTNLALRSTLRLWSKELPGSVAEATVGRPILVATWMSWQIMASKDIVIPS